MVSLPARAPWLNDFRNEILAFPEGRHNDQVDALSQALDRAELAKSFGFVRTREDCCAGIYFRHLDGPWRITLLEAR
jgi:hypothetical protein